MGIEGMLYGGPEASPEDRSATSGPVRHLRLNGWGLNRLDGFARCRSRGEVTPKPFRRHQEDILSYFEMRIDNGAVEGMNNKAKVVSHRCYGFRTASNYITALYHCLGKLPELELVHSFV